MKFGLSNQNTDDKQRERKREEERGRREEKERTTQPEGLGGFQGSASSAKASNRERHRERVWEGGN